MYNLLYLNQILKINYETIKSIGGEEKAPPEINKAIEQIKAKERAKKKEIVPEAKVLVISKSNFKNKL